MNPKHSLIHAPGTQSITNSRIEQLLAMRETQKGLKDRLKLMDEAVDKAEEELIHLLDSGADSASCGYAVNIQENVRRYPAWKEHFISRLGKDVADTVMESTSPVLHRKLVIK